MNEFLAGLLMAPAIFGFVCAVDAIKVGAYFMAGVDFLSSLMFFVMSLILLRRKYFEWLNRVEVLEDDSGLEWIK